MPYLNPPQNGVKPSSRFSTLNNVLKLKPGSGASSLGTVPELFSLKLSDADRVSVDVAPPPPPKDSSYTSSPNPSLNPPPSMFYNKSFFSRSATSLSPSLSPDTNSGPATPSSPYPPMSSIGFEFGKRSNSALGSASGRAAAASPVPSASGGSLNSVSRGGRDYLPSPSMEGSTDSSGSCPNTSSNPNANLGIYLLNGANSSSSAVGQATTSSVKPKKSVFKLTSLGKRNRSRKNLSDTASASGSVSRTASLSEHEGAPEKAEGDEGISSPWNFQVGMSSGWDNHSISFCISHSTTYMLTKGECQRFVFAHTCSSLAINQLILTHSRSNRYIGLPPSWSATLSQVGFGEDEIAAIHARRRAAATCLASSTNLANQHTTYSASPHALTVTPSNTSSASSSTTLLEPVPRSTSLGKGRDALTIHPTSMYSVATSTTGGLTPAPSPRAPSFSMKSFVSGIKNSLTSDSASTKEDVGSSRRSEGAVGEESEQFVIVDGDGPDEGGDQGMGDETLIEPYPFDSSSVSSHHTHTSRIRQLSQVITLGSHCGVVLNFNLS